MVHERLRVLNDGLDGVLRVTSRIRLAADEGVRAEDSTVGSRFELLGREELSALLDLVDEGVLDQSLVEEEGVVVDHVDEVGARRGAGSASELLGFGGVLWKLISALHDGGRAGRDG